MIGHGIIGDLDHIQRGARAGVRRFTPRGGRSIPFFPSFRAGECCSWFEHPCHLLEDLYATPAFAWHFSARYFDHSKWRQDAQISADVKSGKISLVDLSGTSENELMAALSASSYNSTYLVTPVPMYLTLTQGISSCTALERRIFPHLDLDHVPESTQAGGYDALSLGIYAVERGCMAVELAGQGTFVT